MVDCAQPAAEMRAALNEYKGETEFEIFGETVSATTGKRTRGSTGRI